jgi:AcrR family transcriptional regulator
MPGLRVKMKERRREQILVASQMLFRESGYSKTSLAEIAEKAEVSIGTIYTYFGSKGAIYYELAKPLLTQVTAKADRVIQSPPADPIEAMLALFEALRFTKEWQNLNLMKGLDPNQKQQEQDSYIEQTQREAHDLVMKKVYSLLLRMQVAGRVHADLNLDDATFLLAMLMRSHLSLFVGAGGELPYAEHVQMMSRRVRLLFEPWTAPSGRQKK